MSRSLASLPATLQIGSKEEVAFLLALFGTHTQPVRQPKPKSSRGWRAMPGSAECQSLLRLLIARGDPKAIRLDKGAIDQYLNTAPLSARGRGLRVLQRDALDQHDVAVGVQRSFAETLDAYIELKLAE